MSYLQTSVLASAHPYRRRIIGALVAASVQLGFITVMLKGLDIGKAIDLPPPSTTRVIEPPPVTPPPPKTWNIDTFRPSPATFVAKEPLIAIEQAQPVSEGMTTATTPPGGETGDSGANRLYAAKVDPAHPLKQPAYPPQSRRLGEEGRVELLVYVLADGRVGEARIANGSGYNRLDEAALREATRSWRFVPQQVGSNAVASWQSVAITFRLKN